MTQDQAIDIARAATAVDPMGYSPIQKEQALAWLLLHQMGHAVVDEDGVFHLTHGMVKEPVA